MKALNKIKDKYEKLEISAEAALEQIFNLYLLNEETLLKNNLQIIGPDYGVYQLRQNGSYIMEGEKIKCQERALEIINASKDA